jgi:outer membrane protein assembly factor BamE (lipoprotein component of BamABCDE complex)
MKRLLFVLMIFGAISSCAVKNKKNIQLMEQIKPGMSKEEVIKVLGNPVHMGRSVDSSFHFNYQHTTSIFGDTKLIVISFGKRGKVLSTSIMD